MVGGSTVIRTAIIWLAGLGLVTCLAMLAWGAALKRRIMAGVKAAEPKWQVPDLLPHDDPLDPLDTGHGWWTGD